MIRRIAALALVLVVCPLALFAEPAATILTAYGDVTVVQGGVARSAASGMRLEPGDRVSAGANGSAALLLAGGTTVNVDANSSISIPEVSGGGGGALRAVWQNVVAKFSESEGTHVALGTVGAVRGEEGDAVLEDYDYFPGDAEAHADEQAALDDLFAAGTLEPREYHLLSAVTAEYYERFATAEDHYREALSEAGGVLVARVSAGETGASIQGDGSSNAVVPDAVDSHVILLLADLFARNDYYARAAALAALAGD